MYACASGRVENKRNVRNHAVLILVNLESWCQRWKEWLQEGGNFQSNVVDPGIAHRANFFPISCCRTKHSTKPKKRPETTSALQRHKCFIFSFTFPGTVYYPMKQVFVCLFSADFSGGFSVEIFHLHLKMTFMYSFFYFLQYKIYYIL